MKVVIDTNDYISALIGMKHREKLEKVILNKDIEILADLTLLSEIKEVAYRDKFRKYVSIEQVEVFIETLKLRLKPIQVFSEVDVSKDPDDNFLLALAQDGNADYLITGDKSDLLSLESFEGIPIIRLNTFIELIETKSQKQ
ncbi:putative toxin-antitoxin system toxin component, PIN family [Dyadobacter bucti]|uniref:putative toxin-antitoxin system toxin component, PIN family n=1 Tax=Dyadobacter bucti TaxID=2572203 RepID=UPI003F70C10F